jgi:hypothetical protein
VGLKRTVSAIVVFTAGSVSAAAGQSGVVGARASILAGLTVAAVDSLILGPAYPNATRTVLPSDPASGSFTLTGVANAEVNLTFTLPPALSDGTSNLPIAFGGSAASRSTTSTRATSTPFNPNAPQTTRLNATTGILAVYIGGSVTPTNQPAGNYTATITLNAAYTGN